MLCYVTYLIPSLKRISCELSSTCGPGNITWMSANRPVSVGIKGVNLLVIYTASIACIGLNLLIILLVGGVVVIVAGAVGVND